MTEVIVALITGGLTLIGVVIAEKEYIYTKFEELKFMIAGVSEL